MTKRQKNRQYNDQHKKRQKDKQRSKKTLPYSCIGHTHECPVKYVNSNGFILYTKTVSKKMVIKNPEVRNLYNIRKLQLLLNTL